MPSVSIYAAPSVNRSHPHLHLPRILCLHGGGTNARIFKAQCRRLAAELQSEFRFIYAEAPWQSEAGPDVMAVYGGWGPFKRWLRWSSEHPEITTEETVRELSKSLSTAIEQDDACGATDEVVAILGFSQGAKLAASLLYRQQIIEESLYQQFTHTHFRFGVLLAGSGPLVDLSPSGCFYSAQSKTRQNDESEIGPRPLDSRYHRLSIPTVHLHGLRDKGIERHRELLENFCEHGSTILVEWDGDHRIPIKRKDVDLVADQIRKLAVITGVY